MKTLVLLGGGHSHAIALRLFGLHPVPKLRLILISEAAESAYSGMLPGHVAGFYSRAECHIDLRQLIKFAGAQFYIDRAIGLDLVAQQVLCAQGPPIPFDVLSIDTGSTPSLPLGVDFCYGIPAKPVRQFLDAWQAVVEEVSDSPHRPIRLAIIGGGVGGVELAFNIQHRLHQILRTAHQPLFDLQIDLLHRGAKLLPQQGPWVRDRVLHLFAQRGIQVYLGEEVRSVQSHSLICQSGFTRSYDFMIWVTQATAPDWLSKSGLTTDHDGFIAIGDTLQSLSHPFIFATGDVATMVNHPRPKAGVFAVRQGKPLFRNLRRFLMNQPLQPFYPQKRYLSLIGTADGKAIAAWGNWGWHSAGLWRWKQWIDRRFMKRFSEL